MNTIGLIGAMDEEVAILKEQMTDTKEMTKAGMTFVEGNLWGLKTVVVVSGIGKHQSRLVCFHGRDHIFILFRDIYHLNMFKVNRRILGIILQPRQDYLVTKKWFLHKPFPPFLLILLLYLKPHDKTTAFIIS